MCNVAIITLDLLIVIRRIRVYWDQEGYEVRWYNGTVGDFKPIVIEQTDHSKRSTRINVLVHDILFDGEEEPVKLCVLGSQPILVGSAQ